MVIYQRCYCVHENLIDQQIIVTNIRIQHIWLRDHLSKAMECTSFSNSPLENNIIWQSTLDS